MDLSKTMIDVVNVMKEHKELIRYEFGFWSWEGVEIKHTNFKLMENYDCPEWHCDIKTLRALARRKIVTLDEDKQVCKLN